jgi:hypothetical protein
MSMVGFGIPRMSNPAFAKYVDAFQFQQLARNSDAYDPDCS